MPQRTLLSVPCCSYSLLFPWVIPWALLPILRGA